MDEEINKNKLESNFRKQLRDQRPAKDGWNIPSDDLWDKLDKELDQEAFPKKKKKRWLFFLLLPLFLISASFFLYHSFNQPVKTSSNSISADTDLISKEKENATIAKVLDHKSNNFNNNPEKSLQKKTDSNNSPTIEDRTVISDQKYKKSAPLISNKKVTRNATDTKPSKKFNTLTTTFTLDHSTIHSNTPTIPHQTLITADENSVIKSQLASKESTIPTTKSKSTKKYTLISVPSLSAPLYQIDQPETDRKVVPYISLPSSKRLTLGIYYAPTMTFANVKDQLSSSVESIDISRNAAYANRFGVNLEKQIARHWSIGLGLEYTHFRVDSEYLVGVPYSSEDERQNALGNYEKNYQHSLPSSFGKLNTEFGLDRLHDEIVPENELLHVTMSLAHQLHVLSIPLYARYHIDHNKWRYSLMAGVQTNFWLGQPNTTLTTSLSHHTAVHHRHTSVENDSAPELKNTSFGYLFGLGIEYQIADQIYASFQPNYQGSFTPLYKDDNFKSYPSSLGLQVGIRYGF